MTSVPKAVAGAAHADEQAAFAATLADEWARCGVTHAVVCPGSRSTPLALALAGRSDVTVHVRLDERSAAFTALGIGLATGRPAVVLTTSGTAAAELHAAVVEADLAGVPLLACTADRPPELRGVGAPQAIDQAHLFGRSVRWYADPGVPGPADRPAWRSLAARAVAEAVAGPRGPGPVHLNLPFREPLLGDAGAAGGPAPGRGGAEPWHAVRAVPAAPPEEVVAELVEASRAGRRGVVVAGAGCGDPGAAVAMAAALGWPLLADPRSGARLPGRGVVATADGVLRSERFAAGHRPEVVLRLGAPWASKVVNAHLAAAAAAGATTVVVDPWARWNDPDRAVTAFVRAAPEALCRAVLERLGRPGPAPAVGAASWLGSWCAAEDAARAAVEATVGSSGEPALARRLYAAIPGDGTLVVSSSMPVRDLEAFAAPRTSPPRVLANRGANGIDGVVSTAVGVALAATGPTVALVGDLAFLHDVSALVRGRGADVPCTVVVADNGGGGIFSFLAPAAALDRRSFESLFGTPQEPDVAAVAAGFGLPVDDVGPDLAPGALEDLLGRHLAGGTFSVVRVRVPDRDANVDAHARITGAVVEAVDAQQGRGS